MPMSSNSHLTDGLQELLPKEGRWLLEVTKVGFDIMLAMVLLLYVPYLAVAVITAWLFSYLKTPRQQALAVVPGVWGSLLLISHAGELACIPTYLGIRRITSTAVDGVRDQLCRNHC